MAERTVSYENTEYTRDAFGTLDENLKRIEHAFHVSFSLRDSEIRITGELDDINKAESALQALLHQAEIGETLDQQRVSYLIDLVSQDQGDSIQQLSKGVVCITAKGKPVKAKTVGQVHYIEAIRTNTITIGVGPAGTGKTFLAVAAAVTAYRQKQISRIILTRPAVEAGERLGFLPGDLQNKVDPYLRPLNDALYEMLGSDTYARLLERGDIEVAPLAYMRGRTLDESFIILDEAQNTTREQMKMFLTRLGFGSKIVITGDITQIDLPKDQTCGLKEAVKVLEEVDDIAVVHLTAQDVVRHQLVQKIVAAYESYEKHNIQAEHPTNMQPNHNNFRREKK